MEYVSAFWKHLTHFLLSFLTTAVRFYCVPASCLRLKIIFHHPLLRRAIEHFSLVYSLVWKTTLSPSHTGAGDSRIRLTWGLSCSIWSLCLLSSSNFSSFSGGWVWLLNVRVFPPAPFSPAQSTSFASLEFWEKASRFRGGNWQLLSSLLNFFEIVCPDAVSVKFVAVTVRHDSFYVPVLVFIPSRNQGPVQEAIDKHPKQGICH